MNTIALRIFDILFAKLTACLIELVQHLITLIYCDTHAEPIHLL